MRTTANTAPVSPVDVMHAAASYQADSPERRKAYCGAQTGPIAAGWNYATCPDCKKP